jgi:hypothetical protein
MFQFNKKTIIIIVVVVLIVAGAAVGLKFYKAPKAAAKAPVGVEKEMVVPPASGWISSPGAATPGPTSATVNVGTNGTELISISVNITIKDDDGQHTQTDGGSDPDTVSVKIGNDTFEMTTDKASGMASATKEYSGEKVSQFGKNISILITGTKFGGGNRVYGPIGIIPIPGLAYVDQGVGYTVEVKYSYMYYAGH